LELKTVSEVYDIDFRLPGMEYAALSPCPTIGGKVTAFEEKESKKISGLSYVRKISDLAGLRGE
jgi:hypothetical protein